MKEKKIEKCCGNCCWFYGKTTDGDGFCAEAKESSWRDHTRCDKKCWLSLGGCDNPCFVSRQDMRHHMAVIAKRFRSLDNPRENYNPFLHDEKMALKFAFEYMRVFSKL